MEKIAASQKFVFNLIPIRYKLAQLLAIFAIGLKEDCGSWTIKKWNLTKFYTLFAFFAPKEATFRHNYYDQVALILKELSNEPNIIAQLAILVSGFVSSTPLVPQ